MEKKCVNNRNGGFSVVEMLAVVAILVILLGISMVSVVRYRDLLKITELDNAAREIYMAAENRAVLLSGARRLSSQVKSAGQPTKLSTSVHADAGDEDLYYVSKAQMTEDLLKTGSIDPALRKDGVDFYIVYDRNRGSVTDVFYAEEKKEEKKEKYSLSGLVGTDFASFYANWANKSPSYRLDYSRRENTILVGYYYGKAAEGRDEELEIPKVPIINVIIKNEEELTVTVEYSHPGELTDGSLSVKLGNIDLTDDSTFNARKRDETVRTGTNGVSYTCTWVLDSLTGGQFKALNSNVTPGENFTVEAALTPGDGKAFETVTAKDDNNSLFQEGSGGETAYIRYLRHLQNLDEAFSDVADKKTAVQTENILGDGGGVYPNYNFIPIINSNITEYNGRNHEIRNLYVDYNKDENSAGLFSKTSENMKLRYIRMVNATVKTKGKFAGALAGEANNASIQNCWVYWETDETVTDLKGVLVEDAEKNEYNYQIVGKCAGGLVGVVKGGTQITGSLAATLVSGTDSAGGLIGKIESNESNEITIQRSYADCYLTGTGTASKVAGLVGDMSSTSTVTLTNCYAAGYILGGKSAAGLCMGDGTTKATNVYSVMRYPGRTLGAAFTYLTEKQATDPFTKTYFLYEKTKEIEVAEGKEISGRSFDDMSASGFVTIMGSDSFQSRIEDSHPYELRVPLGSYDYPGLKNLPHYGDWGRELAPLSLVYYENDGGTSRVSGIGVRDKSLDDNAAKVTVDGYALLLRQRVDKGYVNDAKVEVTYSYFVKDDLTSSQNVSVEYTLGGEQVIEADGKKDKYYVLPLPAELVDSGYAEKSFYRYIHFKLELVKTSGTATDSDEGEAFFNPHFAETVQTARLKEGAEGGWNTTEGDPGNVYDYAGNLAKDIGEIKVRTPRHLYSLSRFAEYYTRTNKFHQILDLDYSTYTGYNNKYNGAPFTQQPIGSNKDDAFEGTYEGGYHLIKNVVPGEGRQYEGLFGYTKGKLSNIVYQMDPEKQVSVYLQGRNMWVGALAGGSEGAIDNCAVFDVNLKAGISGAWLHVGGLVGWNGGTIRNCEAELARLSADCFNFGSVYIGGLVGENAASRTISRSYAVGRINVEVDNTISTAYLCGFAGVNENQAVIDNSYAAVSLSYSGDNVGTYGFSGVQNGGEADTAYLDQGNFTYRKVSYAAKYKRDDDIASSLIYEDLTKPDDKDPAKPDAVPGMSLTGKVWDKGTDEREAYPYPASVKDKAGNYIHYGAYPEPMPLGDMGVFYWEKMVDAETGGKPTYHMSALAVDPKRSTITKQSTLSEEHNDGRVVTDYGYGYYAGKEVSENVRLSVENIGYTQFIPWKDRSSGELPDVSDKNGIIKNPTDEDAVNSVRDSDSEKKETDAKKGLEELNPKYTFHCWNSYHEGARAASGATDDDRAAIDTAGLVLVKPNKTDQERKTPLDVNSGTFILKQGKLEITFIVNPQFADSMSVSVEDSSGLEINEEDKKIKEVPGSSANPYQVRCGTQLQEINCHDTLYTDVPITGDGRFVFDRFPYLSGEKDKRDKYYWKQTHDIDWTAEGNTYTGKGENSQDKVYPGVFFAIAQTRSTNSSLPGWFGGHYDGQNYTIKNLNIGINTDQYEVNCMGLFAVARDATLNDIVMFSETGQDVVTVNGRYYEGEKYHYLMNLGDQNDAWFAGGALVGLAWESTVSNCAVAGYTIRVDTQNARTQDMGGTIGGLVGMTNKELRGCTAATSIEIVCNHRDKNHGSAAPIRVGGLVGSTTANVTDCYTGGEIVTSIKNEKGDIVKQAQNSAIYAGRLIGGLGMGPHGGEDQNASTTISNCYSYLTLPNEGGVVKKTYKIGGLGRTNNNGTVTVEKAYYLDTAGAAGDGGGTSVTYRQLEGKDAVTGAQKIYDLLTGFSPVTSEFGGVAVGGRYSYVPQSRKELQGLDYPFPTILTQPGLHVHYGDWPLKGIERSNGGEHIRLDMFAKRLDKDGNVIGSWREHTEQLKAVNVKPDGAWSVSVSEKDKDIFKELEIGQDGKLTIKAQKSRLDAATITITYTEPGTEPGTEPVGERTYSMDLKVFVSAEVRLNPSGVKIFPNDTLTVPLSASGVNPVTGAVVQSIGGILTVKSANMSQSKITAACSDNPAGIILTRGSGGNETDTPWADVTYTFLQDDYTSDEMTQRVAVTLLDLPVGKWNEDGTVWTMEFTDYSVSKLTAAYADTAPAGFGKPGTTGTAITLTKPENVKFPEEGVKLSVTLTMEGLEHKLTVTVPPKPEADAPEAETPKLKRRSRGRTGNSE